MKRLLYIAPISIKESELNGVEKKVLSHCKCLNKHFLVDLIYYYNGEVYVLDISSGQKEAVAKGNSSISVLKATKKIAYKYQFVYIRYPKSSPWLIGSIKHFKNCKIVMEIPTYPYELEGRDSLKGTIEYIVDKIYRKKLKKYVGRIVTYSDDSNIFGIQTINTINGIDFSNTKMSNYDTNQKDIHMIAVSNVYQIHGYDRIIYGLYDFYKKDENDSKINIVLDIIGEGPYLSFYKSLVEEMSLSEHVIFHGKVFGSELDNLYDQSLLAINSLAIHRQNLKKESTLKAKEYAAKGLPIISSSFIDSFSEEDNNKYVWLVSPDESNVNISALLNFLYQVYYKKSTLEVRNDIRNAAMNICDMEMTLKPIIDFLEKNNE